MTKDDRALKGAQHGEDLPPVRKRKWTGLAKWLLIAWFVILGVSCYAAPAGPLIELLLLLVCTWGIYKFKHLGFYGFVAIRVLDIAVAVLTFTSYFPILISLTVVLLIVRSRWKDMDPVFRNKRTPG